MYKQYWSRTRDARYTTLPLIIQKNLKPPSFHAPPPFICASSPDKTVTALMTQTHLEVRDHLFWTGEAISEDTSGRTRNRPQAGDEWLTADAEVSQGHAEDGEWRGQLGLSMENVISGKWHYRKFLLWQEFEAGLEGESWQCALRYGRGGNKTGGVLLEFNICPSAYVTDSLLEDVKTLFQTVISHLLFFQVVAFYVYENMWVDMVSFVSSGLFHFQTPTGALQSEIPVVWFVSCWVTTDGGLTRCEPSP